MRATFAAVLWLSACHDPTVLVGKLPKPAIPAADSGGPDAGPMASGAAGAAAMSGMVHGARPLDDTAYDVRVEDAPLAEFCQRTGTAITGKHVGAAASDCEARMERRVFSYGLCACEQLQLDADSFLIDSFDSQKASYAAGQTGGSMGVGGDNPKFANKTELLGNLLVASDDAWNLAAQSFVVSGDLKSNAALTVSSGSARVARDLWLASDIALVHGQLSVDRNAMQAPGHSGLDDVNVAGQRYIANELRVPKPCRCDDSAPIDVAAIVAQAREHNDNAATGFKPDSLSIDSGVTDVAALPCGRLYATTVTLRAPSTYIVSPSGRSALFVQGDLTVNTYATLFLTPIAPGELDVFVAGNVSVEPSSSLQLGDKMRPWATRVYVGGEINAQGPLGIGAQLYAPHATLTLPELDRDTDIYGSVYARDIHLATLRAHYDRAILQSGTACSAPAPQHCAGCDECPNELACVAGSCTPCTADLDCCEPAVCEAGKCQTLVSHWP